MAPCHERALFVPELRSVTRRGANKAVAVVGASPWCASAGLRAPQRGSSRTHAGERRWWGVSCLQVVERPWWGGAWPQPASWAGRCGATAEGARGRGAGGGRRWPQAGRRAAAGGRTEEVAAVGAALEAARARGRAGGAMEVGRGFLGRLPSVERVDWWRGYG